MSYAYKASRQSPFHCSIFFLVSSSCVLLRFSFAIYLFPRVDKRPDFDGFHMLSTDYLQPFPTYPSLGRGFQFSKPPLSSDTSIFSCAARFNLSAMDVLASMNGRCFQAPSAVDQPLPPACAAELSEDGEIFDSDDGDFPSVRQILASPKRAVEVIDLTCDDDGDSESDNGSHAEVSWLRYTRTARYRVTLTPPSLIV
jgi:hypothetical protein